MNINFEQSGSVAKRDELLHHIRQIFKPLEPIWLKIGQDRFLYAELSPDGSDLRINPTRGNGNDKVIHREKSFNADWFIRECEQRSGGAFYLPGQPQKLHTKEHVEASNDIWVEIDTGTTEEQLARYKWFEEISGLDLLLLSSGGKSIHGHLILDLSLPSEEILSLVQILCLILLADPVPASNIVQPMRISGCFRKEKKKHQGLIKLGTKHTLEEVRAGLIKIFQSLDWNTQILEQEKIVLSKERWSALKKPFKPLTTEEKEKGIQPLTAEEKTEEIKQVLTLIDEELFPKRVVKERLSVDYSNLSSSLIVPLKYFLSKENQNNSGGVSDRRNNIGCAFLADLLACAAWLTSNGIPFSGNPYDEFIDYCKRCASGGGWDQLEWDGIYNYLSSKSFTPAITDEGMKKRLHSFRWQNDPDYQAACKAEYKKRKEKRQYKECEIVVLNDDNAIDLDNYDEDDYYLDIDSIPDISTTDYEAILASQDDINISEILGLKEQLNRRKFTPDFSFSYPHLPQIIFNLDTIYAVKSGIGTGKTTVVTDYIADALEGIVQNQETVIFLGYLNSLLRQTIAKQNNKLDPLYGKRFIHINDQDNLDIDNDRLIALCIDSLLKIDLDKVNNCTLVLDEIIALLSHLYFAKTHIKKHRTEIIAKFWALVAKAKTVILLDGNLTDWTLELFYTLGNKPIIKIENTYKVDRKHPYKFLLGTSFEETDKINKNDKRPMIKDIIEQAYELKQINDEIKALTKAKEFELAKLLIAKRKPFVIPCESQRFGESLDILLKDIGLKGYCLDGKTSRLAHSESFLKDPDSFIQVNQLDYLIYSPSAQSGLDISIKGYFKNRYCFFFGVNEVNIVDAFTQFLGRIRDDIPTKVWCRNRAVSGENLHRKINSLYELKKDLDTDFATKITTIVSDESMAAELKIKLLEEYKKAKDVHYDFALAMVQQAKGEQFVLRDTVISRLETVGIEVKKYTEVADEEIKEAGIEYKTKRKERDLLDATAIFNAPEPRYVDGVYESEVAEDLEGFWASSVKASIYNRLPGVQYFWGIDCWGVDFINTIRNTSPKLISQLTLLTKLRNPALNVQASKFPYKKLLKGKLASLWDFKDDVGVIGALRSIGLLELIDSSLPFLISDELPQQIIKACRSWSIRKILGSQGKLSDQDWLRQLLGRVAHKLSAKRIKVDGKSFYQYSTISLCEVESYVTAITDCVTYKLKGIAQKASELPWSSAPILPSNEVLPPVKKSGEVFFVKEAVTLAGHSLESVPTKGNLLTTDYLLSEPQDSDFVPPKNEATRPEKLLQFKNGSLLCKNKKLRDKRRILDHCLIEYDWVLVSTKAKTRKASQAITVQTPDPELTQALKEVDPNTLQGKQDLQHLLDRYGLAKLTAVIEAVTSPPQAIGDKRAVLYTWIGEIITASKLKYVGITHYIKRFVPEYGLVEIFDFSNNGLVCKLTELAAC